MPLSKESRNLGQKAAALSATTFALKSLGVGMDQADAPPLFSVVGAENAAAVAGIASILVTAYFLLRVGDEHLATSFKFLVKKGAPVSREIIEDGEDLDSNIFLQTTVKGLIAFADFWLPLGLSFAVAVLLFDDICNLALVWYQHLLN